MSELRDIIVVKKEHIERGIEKYNGRIDNHLQILITNAGYEYTPYLFEDGRVLLVLPNNTSAFLYSNEQTLFERLTLE